MTTLPPRYELGERLGQGGAGEVWAARDRIGGQEVAVKLLSREAGEGELLSLVREATALSGLEGLGVPKVLAFGTTIGEGSERRRYLVRELVRGRSLAQVLESTDGTPWIGPLAIASEKLTALHRAGLLHGDLKPANIIVDEGGSATLVDLGLAAPWREGVAPKGLTPKYAAPELFLGRPITVRAEVFSLGATLEEALSLRGEELAPPMRSALQQIAERATASDPDARFPSVDEFAAAVRQAAGLGRRESDEAAWPVVGTDDVIAELHKRAAALPAGAAMVLVGPAGSGKGTLVRRLAWTLGAEGVGVAMIERPTSNLTLDEALSIELSGRDAPFIFIDDADKLFPPDGAGNLKAISTFGSLLERGSRVVLTSESDEDFHRILGIRADRFLVPPLDPAWMQLLLERVMPSVLPNLVPAILKRAKGRPGKLRGLLRSLAGRAIVSEDELDLVASAPSDSLPPPARSRQEALLRLERLVDMGRMSDAARELGGLPAIEMRRSEEAGRSERVRLAIVKARLEVGRGAPDSAIEALFEVEADAPLTQYVRPFFVARARAHLRRGDYEQARAAAEQVTRDVRNDEFAADAHSVEGAVLAFAGRDHEAIECLKKALAMAMAANSPRAAAVALGMQAIAHQRAGRSTDAKKAYEQSLTHAEEAKDAGTIALTRLNLAGLCREEQDYAAAISHFEAAVDMGRRAGSHVALQGALLGLANLDLYLGRLARARASIDLLEREKERLSPVQLATFLGVQADLEQRSGDLARASALYLSCADAWLAQGRPVDSLEARLERILALARSTTTPIEDVSEDLRLAQRERADLPLGRHEALAELVDGLVALRSGDDVRAKKCLDKAIEDAKSFGCREWEWMALEARSKLMDAEGNKALARRDAEAALTILEETATKLPRDLREVFWNDPRRRVLRVAPTSEVSRASHLSLLSANVRSRISTTFVGVLPVEDRLRVLLELTRELASEHDLPRLLARVTDHAIALLGAERGFIVLTSASGEFVASAARGRAGSDALVEFSHSIAERVVLHGEPVVTTRASEDARFREALSVHEFSIQSVACVPIRGGSSNRPIGALYLETRARLGTRFESELPTLLAFADQSAIAIESARLLTENRTRAEELARANQELSQAKERLAELLGRRTEQLTATRRNLREVRASLQSHFGYGGLTGTSAAMRRVYAILDRVKDTSVPVLITGESGTGKEVVAKAIHSSGPRAKRAFIGVNCGAIPETLLEGELFGHVRGAFTGADRDRRGLFREADGGTLLLDEVGELPHKMQAVLLRVLQEGLVRPVGGNKEEPVDARVIAATNRDLRQMVQQGTFREDLFYRLHVVEIALPPLRERIEDLPALVDHFLGIFSAQYKQEKKGLSRDALRTLTRHSWPGNVRELEHTLLNAWLFSEGDELTVDDLQSLARVHERTPNESTDVAAPLRAGSRRRTVTTEKAFRISEKEQILEALTAANWNRALAAKRLGLARRTFYRRLKEFEII